MRTLRLIVICLLLPIVIAAGVWLAKEVGDAYEKTREASLPRTTEFPAGVYPDQVCLTWSDDPRTTQTIQWRTAPTVAEGVVQYRRKGEGQEEREGIEKWGNHAEVKAESLVLVDPRITNDPVNNRFTAVLTDLMPDTAYEYRVGSVRDNVWTEWSQFTTAPEGAASFSFVYLGDAQQGFDAWGRLLHRVRQTCPEAAFCIIAGDLVNRGNDRDDWNSFFNAAAGFFDRIPLVPAIGNHECPGETEPRLYLQLFALPQGRPDAIPPERAYSLHYGNALFVILDSNLAPEDQRPWLEEQLARSQATWKFAVYHHPAYSSKASRDNPTVREYWCDLFDRYHVDMVFQGHDHAYLRTYPVKGNRVVSSPAEGTIFVVAVSGAKFYEQENRDYTAVGMVNTPTYQIINIETQGVDRLTYRAYDMSGNLRDEVVIEK